MNVTGNSEIEGALFVKGTGRVAQTFCISDQRLTHGSTPASNAFSQIYFGDKTLASSPASIGENIYGFLEMGVRADGSTDLKMTAIQNVSGETGYASLITGWKEYDGKLTAYVAGPYTPNSAYKNELICAQWANGKYLRIDGSTVINANEICWSGSQTKPYPVFRRMLEGNAGDNFVLHGMNQKTFICSGEAGKASNDAELLKLPQGSEDIVLCSDNAIVLASGANGDDFTKVKRAIYDSNGNLTIPAGVNSSSITTSGDATISGITTTNRIIVEGGQFTAKTTNRSYNVIQVDDYNQNGGGCYYCGFGGLTAIGGGESASTFRANHEADYGVTGESEQLFLTSDNNIWLITNANFWENRVTHQFFNNGYTKRAPGTIKGTAGTTNHYLNLSLCEESANGTANRFGCFEIQRTADQKNTAFMRAYDDVAGSTAQACIAIAYHKGTVTTTAPTPPVGDRSTQIATTACFDNEGFLGYKALNNINSVKGCFYADSSSGINIESAGLEIVQNADWYLVQFAMKNGNDKSQFVFNSGNIWRRYSDGSFGSETWSDWVQLASADGFIAYSAATPATNDNSTKVATTAWANAKFLPLAGGTVTGTVKAKSFQATSDARLKENKKEVDIDLSNVKPMRYTFKDDPRTFHVGLIAQEVEKVLPEAVTDDADGFKSLDYNAVVAALVGEVNKLKAEVKALKANLR